MADTTDDGFHEIQLNGKQLVFLFMAATVVSVVIFLCGVLVGRGVRTERLASDTSGGMVAAESTPQPAAAVPVPTPAGSDPTTVAPPPAVDELSYFNRLEKPSATEEPLKPPPTVPAAAPAPAVAPIEKAAVPSPAKAQEPRAEQPGSGYAVQIAALNVRSEADGIAKRLNSKGYAAYVLAPSGGTPAVFRVRVGKFGTRREAEAVAARLQKEEQFKPWVTR